ncbi:MAG: protein GlmU [Desulfobacterales bacterium]|nr:protein GlmU [Desulfobacterales bacterium]
MNNKIKQLLEKGVKIPNPESVDISDEVIVDRISGEGVVIYSGCKIFGASTFISKGVNIGYEGPVTIENCEIGPYVKLKGGFFSRAVFLEKVTMGSGSHVREGTILEEEASCAHTVGLKQTILFPFVTLGSLINFCDCFMSGGTSRSNHSEVGSSFIHFNYTPNQDKATPSLLGDVPRGVMIDQPPIFLGGQGGLVGPTRLEFGTITAAGTICRKDELRTSRLILEARDKNVNIQYVQGMYQNTNRILLNNLVYIANLYALREWYNNVRYQFISDDFPIPMFKGLEEKLNIGIDERIKRLKEFKEKLNTPVENLKEELFIKLKGLTGDKQKRDSFLESVLSGIQRNGKNYIAVIKGLYKKDKEIGSQWLQSIVDGFMKGFAING